MPRLPPVTSATLPRTLNRSSIFIVLLLGFREGRQFPECFRRQTRLPEPPSRGRRIQQRADARRRKPGDNRVVTAAEAARVCYFYLLWRLSRISSQLCCIRS